MDQAFIDEMEKKLKAMKEELTKQLKGFAKQDTRIKDDFHSDFPEYGNKDEDNATEVAAYQDNLSLERDLETTLHEVQVALERIKEGKYGICEKCGNEIDHRRLAVKPSAIFCIGCKNL